MRVETVSARARVLLSAVACALLIAAAPAAAQTYTVLHSFAFGQPFPAGLVQAGDGNFYGTTSQGGANGQGSVFKITSAGALTTLYSFAGSDGSSPQAALVQGTDGKLLRDDVSGRRERRAVRSSRSRRPGC